MICIGEPQNIACILYQSMLESASRANEGTPFLACKPDRAQRAFHAAIRAACPTPDRVALRQPSFGGSIVQRIGIQPERFGLDTEGFCGMRDGLLRRYVIFIPGMVIGNDSNANCALHLHQSVRSRTESENKKSDCGSRSPRAVVADDGTPSCNSR